jgi:hypothetical protein
MRPSLDKSRSRHVEKPDSPVDDKPISRNLPARDCGPARLVTRFEIVLLTSFARITGTMGSDSREDGADMSYAKENLSSWRNRILTIGATGALAITLLAGVLAAPAQSAASQSSATQSSSTQAPSAQSLDAMEAAGIKMAFDVASVKPNKSGGRAYSNVLLIPGAGAVYSPTGGLFSAANYPLIAYMAFAYDMTGDQALQLGSSIAKLGHHGKL